MFIILWVEIKQKQIIKGKSREVPFDTFKKIYSYLFLSYLLLYIIYIIYNISYIQSNYSISRIHQFSLLYN